MTNMAQHRVQALLLLEDSFAIANRLAIVSAALKEGIPTTGHTSSFVREAGALASYSAGTAEMRRRLAYFVDRILRGAKPADLPVEQPTEFELVINLTTALALGLTIPKAVLV